MDEDKKKRIHNFEKNALEWLEENEAKWGLKRSIGKKSFLKGIRRGMNFRAKKCAECGINYADPPSDLCPGCQAYRDHQR